MKKSIAIIGNGKVAKSLTIGLLRSGVKKESILIIGRSWDALCYFREIGFDTSIDIKQANDISNIILAVTPFGIGPWIKRLHTLNWYSNQKLICICSGIDIKSSAKFLGIDPGYMVKATINTNVEYSHGIICLSKPKSPSKLDEQILSETKDLFQNLGNVIFETKDDVTKSILSVGSMNAFDSKFIEKLIQKENIPIEKWLSKIKEWLNECKNFDQITKSHKNFIVADYIKNKANVFVDQMNYSKNKAKIRAYETFKSTVLTLCCIPDITLNDIDLHVKKVITKGGCTEKGISNLNTLENFLSFKDFSNAILPAYERTLKFENDALQSFIE